MRDVAADGGLVAVVQHVFPLELCRVHVELPCHDVQLTFVSKESLRIAGCPHMAAGYLVRVHDSFFDETIEDLVWTGAGLSADQISRRLHRSVSSAIE